MHPRPSPVRPSPTLKRLQTAACATLIGAGVLVPIGFAAAATGGSNDAPGTVFVNDSYVRTVSSGFGTAPVGGAYSVLGQPDSSGVLVGSGEGQVNGLRGGHAVETWLPNATAADADVRAEITARAADAAHLYVAAEARRQADGSGYRSKISFASNGQALLTLSRTAAHSVETNLAVKGLGWSLTAANDIEVEVAVTGTNPTVVTARAWPAGTAAPNWTISYADSSSAQVTGSGAVGVWGYVSSSAASASYGVAELTAAIPGAASGAPTGPGSPTSGPSSSTPAPPSHSSPPPSSSAPPSSSTPPSSSSAPPSSGAGTPTAPSNPTPPVTSSGGSRGSVPVGSAGYAVPAGAVFVAPSGSDAAAGTLAAPLQTLHAAVAKAPAGATIVLRAGSYNDDVTVSRSNVTIQAYPGEAVWLDGSIPVSGWTKQGSRWVHAGWTTQFDHSASFATGTNDAQFIDPNHPMAAWPDQVFLDGAQLTQVASPANVTSGTFAVDYSAKTITIGSDPAGHEVRASNLMHAITLAGSGDVVQGLGIRRFATPLPQMGALRVYGTYDTVRNLVLTDNATQAIDFLHAHNTGDHLTVSGSGMTGVHGNESDYLTLSNSVIEGSNAQQFNPSPAAAGIKVTRSVGVTITNDLVQGNLANGIWLDESNRQFTVANNSSLGNAKGVVVELSDTGVVANNVIDGGQYGVWLLDTGDTQVYNNSFADITGYQVALAQDARRQAAAGAVGRDPRMPVPDPSCPWLTRNDVVANNTFTTSGAYQLLALDSQSNIAADSMHLTVDGNVFATHTTGASMVAWGGNNNRIATVYQTPSAFDAAQNPSWTNMQTYSGGTTSSAAAGQSQASAINAVPLPASVAAAVGQPAGSQHLGTF